MRCDQCELLSINGVVCHETGCPNTHKNCNYNSDTDEWEWYEGGETDEWLEDLLDEDEYNPL